METRARSAYRRAPVRWFIVPVWSVAALALLSGCGGDDGSTPAAPATTVENYVPASIDYELQQRSDLGIKTAVATIASRADGKTSVNLNFYVPLTDENRDDVYSVSIRAGSCGAGGAVQRDLGEFSSGITGAFVDAGYDEVNGPIASGDSTVVITEADGKTVAWCGPGA
jgi:hypothetical protein